MVTVDFQERRGSGRQNDHDEDTIPPTSLRRILSACAVSQHPTNRCFLPYQPLLRPTSLRYVPPAFATSQQPSFSFLPAFATSHQPWFMPHQSLSHTFVFCHNRLRYVLPAYPSCLISHCHIPLSPPPVFLCPNSLCNILTS